MRLLKCERHGTWFMIWDILIATILISLAFIVLAQSSTYDNLDTTLNHMKKIVEALNIVDRMLLHNDIESFFLKNLTSYNFSVNIRLLENDTEAIEIQIKG